uniref:Uncharacterized protein n=1 Tax=Chelonoidis abingdonii TaxID=106734 RepID=A0A8C0GAX9_CHEAB
VFDGKIQIPPELIELLIKNFSIPLACVSQPPTSLKLLYRTWGLGW